MFSQLAGRPARHGPHWPHLGSGSTTTRWPTSSPPAPALLPKRGHAADELVTQDHTRVRGVARRDVEDLEVAATDPARLDFDDDVVVGLDDRIRDVLEREDAAALEDRGPHQPACRRRRIRPVNRRARPSATPARPSVPRVATSMTVATALTSGVTPNFTRV